MYIHDTLLLACGTAANRSAIRSLFEDNFNLLEAENVHQAFMLLRQNHSCIAAILLDHTVSEKLDPLVLNNIEALSSSEEIPIIVFIDPSSQFTGTLAYEHGAVDVITYPYDSSHLFFRIQNIVNLYRHKWHLEEKVDEQTRLLRHFNESIVDALASIIEHRSVESGRHILRIRRFTQILMEEIARSCPEYELTPETINIISSASALHDVGKISIPDSILNKPGKLTAEEWTIMKNHTITGCQILESLHDIVNQDYLKYAHNICHYHHERWNGGGYPEGISGTDIPLCAQVVGLADAYDALTTKRVYKDSYSCDQAVNMILNGECGTFSPRLLECFKAQVHNFEKTARAYADGLSPQKEEFDVTLLPVAPAQNQGSLHRLQHKYQTLLHYLDATAIEANLEKNYFHMIYNPYPELSILGSGNTLTDFLNILKRFVIPQDLERLKTFLRLDIPKLLIRKGHRSSCVLHTRNASSRYPIPFRVTVLNSSSAESERSLLILCRKEHTHTGLSPVSEKSEDSLSEKVRSVLLLGLFSCRMDQWMTFETIGHHFETLLGYTQDDIQNRFHNHFGEMILPEDRETMLSFLNEQLSQNRFTEFCCRMRHQNGSIRWLLHRGYLDTSNDGYDLFYVMSADITQNTEKQNHQLLTLEQYQTILNLKNNVLFDWNVEHDQITVSKQWEDIFGYEPITGNLAARLDKDSHFHPEDIPLLLQHIRALTSGSSYQAMEARIAKADGRYLWCRIQATATCDSSGALTRIVGTIINIDNEKQAAKHLQEQAERDALTRLYNKSAARRQSEEYLTGTSSPNCAFLIIDMDNFKQINDTYGHLFGDTVLSQAAKELRKLFRSQDIIARIGGDEFLVVMRGISDQELIAHRCRRLLAAIKSLFPKQLSKTPLGCSIGISLCPAAGISYQELFQHADQALYLAKNDGRNTYHFYDPDEVDHFQKRRIHTTAINARIDSDEQPGLANDSIVQHIFQELHKSTQPKNTITNLLRIIGTQINASRVYVFENSPDNQFCTNTYEWCNIGIAPQKQYLQHIDYQADIPGYEQNFDENGVFYCPDITQLHSSAAQLLQSQNIRSVLQCAILDNGIFSGFVGFDECSDTRCWTQEEIDILTLLSNVISVFLLKERVKDHHTQRENELLNILDHQKALVYIVDPDTFKLIYLNRATRNLSPSARPGEFCYHALMQRNSPCLHCPISNIRLDKERELILDHKLLGCKALCEASLTNWEQKEAGLIFCRRIPE